jgi:hypothetical protein
MFCEQVWVWVWVCLFVCLLFWWEHMANSIAKGNIKHKPTGEHPPTLGQRPKKLSPKLTRNLVFGSQHKIELGTQFGVQFSKVSSFSSRSRKLVPKIQFGFLLMETKTDTDGSNRPNLADPPNNTGSNLNGCWRKCVKLEQGVTNTLARPINKMLYTST